MQGPLPLQVLKRHTTYCPESEYNQLFWLFALECAACLHWNILLLLCFGRKHWFSRIACYEYLESTSSIYLFQTCSKFFHLRLVLLLGLLMYWVYGRFGRPSCLLRTNHHRSFPTEICESCLFHQRGLSDQRSSRIKRGFWLNVN